MTFTTIEPSQKIDLGFAPSSPAFDLRFFLTDVELREAVTRRKTFWRSTEGKILTRVVTGVGTIYFLLFPYMHGQTWPQFLGTSPIRAIYMAGLAIFDFWVATGSLGVEYLNGIANRLDLERRIILFETDLTVIHGKKKRQFNWKQLRGFQETPNLFMLLTGEHTFWTLPKRTLPSTDISRLRSFLLTKTAQR